MSEFEIKKAAYEKALAEFREAAKADREERKAKRVGKAGQKMPERRRDNVPAGRGKKAVYLQNRKIKKAEVLSSLHGTNALAANVEDIEAKNRERKKTPKDGDTNE